MKSVIHEASSIAKAIEQGWVKAGKPKDFTVKIFEEPKKNFLGFTTKNAKVGIFIEEKHPQRGDHRQKKHAPQQRRGHHRGDWRRQNDRRHDDQQGQRNDQQFDGRRQEQRPQQERSRDRDQQSHDQRNDEHTRNGGHSNNGNGNSSTE